MDALDARDIPAFLARGIEAQRAVDAIVTEAAQAEQRPQNSQTALAITAAHSLVTLAKHSYAAGANDQKTGLMITDALGLLWAIAQRLARQPMDAVAIDALHAMERQQLCQLDHLKSLIRAAGMYAETDERA